MLSGLQIHIINHKVLIMQECKMMETLLFMIDIINPCGLVTHTKKDKVHGIFICKKMETYVFMIEMELVLGQATLINKIGKIIKGKDTINIIILMETRALCT